METASYCPQCGTQLIARQCPRCDRQQEFGIFRREILWLVLMAALTVPLYMGTRSLAAWNREIQAQTAASWYQRGEQERQGGDIRAALTSFHRATVNDRENFQYAMSWAVALAAAGQTPEARLALVRLRDSTPENAQINLELARLAAKQANVPEAARYYRNALYGVWPDPQGEQHRREARIELIRFLLDHQERSTALSELLLLSREIPANSASYTLVARLLLEAGEAQRALDQFPQASREKLAGLVTRQSLEEAMQSSRRAEMVSSLLADVWIHVHPDHSLEVALDRFSQNPGLLPVVSRSDLTRIEGVVTLDSILRFLQRGSQTKEP